MNIELVNILGGLLIAGGGVAVTYILARHKPKVDRETAALAVKQHGMESLKAASDAWSNYAQVQTNRALAAEAAAEEAKASAREAAATANECKRLSEEALVRADRAERYNSILLEHWPEGAMLPRQP